VRNHLSLLGSVVVLVGSAVAAQQTSGSDPEARHRLIASIAANLRQHYFNHGVGQQLADRLLVHDKNDSTITFHVHTRTICGK
jgi:hypothetical protein